MKDNDFDGLAERNDFAQQHDMEQQEQAVSEILDSLDKGERLNSGQMLLLRWYVGIPEVKDLRQFEMAVGGDN